MMQEVEVLKTIPELVCSYFSEEQFTLSGSIADVAHAPRICYNRKVALIQRKILQRNCTAK